MRRLTVVMLLLAGVLCPAAALGDKAASLNRKGIALYNEKRYEESVNQFTEALVERPKAPELRFNRGTALSALGKKDEAVEELTGAAGDFKRKDRSAAALYNAGNAFFAGNDYKGAVEAYRRAVSLDQKSQDIRYNLELALRKLKDQQKKEEAKKDSQKKDDQKNDRQEKKTPQNENKQTMEQKKSQQQQSNVRPMTKEEAERLLDAMNADEKQSLALKNKQMKTGMGPGDDW